MGNSVRDVMKDRMRDIMADVLMIDPLDVDAEVVGQLADEAFSVCGIPEKEQDEEW